MPWRKAVISPDNDCWLFMGPLFGTGYGQVRANGKPAYAHRIAWAMFNAEQIVSFSVKRWGHLRACAMEGG